MKIRDQVRYTHALELDECLSLAVLAPDCSGTAKAVCSQPLATYNTINLVYQECGRKACDLYGHTAAAHVELLILSYIGMGFSSRLEIHDFEVLICSSLTNCMHA